MLASAPAAYVARRERFRTDDPRVLDPVSRRARFQWDGDVEALPYTGEPPLRRELAKQAGGPFVGDAEKQGLLMAQPFVGAVVARSGSRPVVAAAPLYVTAVVLPAVAVNALTLLLAIIAVGAANGTLDISMNVQGLAVELSVKRALFSSLHAAFSFGALAGAGLAAMVASAGMAPLPHLIGVALVGALVMAGLARSLVADEDQADAAAPRFVRPSRALLALGVVAFCALLAEGAVFDWSGIYLARVVGASEGIAPLALAAFSLTMGAGRLLGDGAAARLGGSVTVLIGALLATAGLTLSLALPSVPGAISGFAIMGMGLSVVFPLTLRAAGGRERSPGPAIAAVSTLGYMGFLLGPPAIGILAEATGLRAALSIVGVACVVAAVLSIGQGRGLRMRSSET